jgi:hypothetical protein
MTGRGRGCGRENAAPARQIPAPLTGRYKERRFTVPLAVR